MTRRLCAFPPPDDTDTHTEEATKSKGKSAESHPEVAAGGKKIKGKQTLPPQLQPRPDALPSGFTEAGMYINIYIYICIVYYYIIYSP
jgi:hypothetical protein